MESLCFSCPSKFSKPCTCFFTITAKILAHSLANFHCQYADTDTWVYNLNNTSTSESEQFDNFAITKKNKWCQFFMLLFRYWQYISSLHCQSSLRIHSVITSWIHSDRHSDLIGRRIKNWRQIVKSYVACWL